MQAEEVGNAQNAIDIDEVLFEQKDVQIFSIPDTKTKLSTLQNYFFPRLEKLLRYTLDVVSDVYQVNPYETMTFVYCPSHRQDAKQNRDYGLVHIGITAKRSVKPLKIIKRNGQPFFLHPTYLTFKVLPNGAIYTELLPFRQGVDDAYVAAIAALAEQHRETLYPLLSSFYISHTSDLSYCAFLPLHEAITPDEISTSGIKLVSSRYYFPVNSNRGLNELILAFILLYGLAESFIRIGQGRKPKLAKRLEQFKDWYINFDDGEDDIDDGTETESLALEAISELDSYAFIRPGKWWAVLARDQWKCLSCGRSARKNGITLEVDHIIPRSKGGTDDVDNLQTLCKKCNLGKSNKDRTRL